MTKAELIARIQGNAGEGVSKTTTEAILNATWAAITEALAEGQAVPVPGFGSFAVTVQAEREGRNPRTGETITIPEKRAVKFRAAPDLKAAVNRT